ncbi:Pentatricopeptide repeat-containing protein [Apostasia shenzhenica]|uniref:Pentatricopeptide repeat-containing protein n=1 Tax=Apostasia shenzhenica TaxID=1088818 RepID=A0A2I0A0Z6_9ASPA|nr:Pentatricopeptide repeat-containing protein [Apostasia shenzhenica]
MTLFLYKLQWYSLFTPSLKTKTLTSLFIFYHRILWFFPLSWRHICSCSSDTSSSRNLVGKLLLYLDSCSQLTSLRRSHALILIHGLSRSLPLQTKLLTSYAVLGSTKCAELVFFSITNPDLYSLKEMLKCYLMNNYYLEAISFYKRMRIFPEARDNIVISLVLKACIKLLDLDEGKRLHCHIIKVTNPDDFVLNGLIDMYAKCGNIKSACYLFDKIHSRSVVSWTTIISGLVMNDHAEEALLFFEKMRLLGVEPNEYTIVTLLSACSLLGAFNQGRWMHGYVLKGGVGWNSFVGSALLDMYVKCGEVIDARAVFDELLDVDVVSWTAMIVGYLQIGCPFEALNLFTDRKWAEIIPNSITIASVLSASGQLHDLDLGRLIHLLGIKVGVDSCSVVVNAIVYMYGKCCAIWEAESVFQRISQKDLVTWNAMMTGYSQNSLGHEALLLFHHMRSEGCLPDSVTVVNALASCDCLGSLHVGCSFHAYAIKFGFTSNIYISTALVNLYNKCGDLKSASGVFDEMSDRSPVTWSVMMGGYGMQGDSTASLDLLHKMLREDLKPNDVTFISILSTCSHNGMVEEGKRQFKIMSQKYDIVPSMKHYVCMVDLLSRAGRLEEAMEFIEEMPVKPEVSIWGALLHGCILHSRSDLGEMVLRKMLKLHTDTPDYYVLMSNLYASDGKWGEALKIRELMKQRRLIKSPGCSFI